MIHSITVKNYTSFKDETTVDFTVGPKAGDRPIFLNSAIPNTKVNAVTGIFGANASGKSNLLKAISFLHMFITKSAQYMPSDAIPVEPFAFVDKTTKTTIPTEFRLEFEFNGQLYRYELKLTSKLVLFESLARRDYRFRYLFERSWNESKNDYDFKSQEIGPARQIKLRKNASFLSSALLQDFKFAHELSACFEACYDNLSYWGRTLENDPLLDNILDASVFFDKNKTALKMAEKILSKLDLGISAIEIREKTSISDGKEQKTKYPYARHDVDGKSYYMFLLKESDGTKSLFMLLRYLISVLDKGGVAIIDEFEKGLHSHMVKTIVEMFYSKETNPHGAQLIASFHSDYLLRDTLEKYQVVLTEKNPDTLSTDAWRLDQMKGAARNVDNLFAKYHAGAYGGIPNI